MEKKEDFVEAICSILEKNKALSHGDAQALKKSFQGRSQITFDDFLLEEGIVEREDLLNALSTYYEVPWMDPIGYFFDHYLLTKFPKDFLLRNLMLPLEIVDESILVVVANNPLDPNLPIGSEKYLPCELQFMVGIASEIVESIEEFYDKSLTDIPRDDKGHTLDETEFLDEDELEKEAFKEIEEFSEEE